MTVFIASVCIVAGLGLILGLALALADKYIAVPMDEKQEKILSLLSGANCGSCGFAGCGAMAKALAEGKASISQCPVASQDNRNKIAELLGVEAEALSPTAAFVGCQGGRRCVDRADYTGLIDCRAAAAEGKKGCPYGCVGLLSCQRVCPMGAISLNEHGVPEIDKSKCVSCGLCVKECPHGLISIKPLNTRVYVACHAKEMGRKVKDVCSVGCVSCGLCAKVCEQHAITLIDHLPVIDNEKCIGCGKCVVRCPQKSLRLG